MTAAISPFIQYSSIALATLCGYLATLPLAIAAPSAGQRIAVSLAGLAAGLLIGLRRRNSRLFFYFCITAVLVLATIFSFSAIPSPL